MKIKSFILAFSLGSSFFLNAQVGIGTDSPDPDSDLTLASDDKGLLINRVELTSTSNASPLTAHVKGMVVYNTQTTGDVTEGLYYNDGSKWVPATGGGGSSSDDWTITGNGNTVAVSGALGSTISGGGNFLGTTNAQNLVLATGNKIHSVLSTDGTMNGVGEATSSFAWGSGNTLGTKNNLALGNGNTASGDFGASIGSNNNNTANNSIALGLGNTVSGNKTFVVGANNNVNATNGTAIIGHTVVAGSNNTVSAINSVVLGHSNNLTSAGLVFGNINQGRGNMFGSNNTNNSTSTLIGVGNTSTSVAGSGSMVLGFAGTVSTTNTTLYANGYHLFNLPGGTAEVAINVNKEDIIENIDLTVSRSIRIMPQVPNTVDINQVNCTTANEGMIRYNLTTRKHEGCGSNNGTTSGLDWRPLY